MQANIDTSTAWQLVAQSDFLSKLILVSLFITSIICVAIIIFKIIYFYKQKKVLNDLIFSLKEAKNFENLTIIQKQYSNSLSGELITEGLVEVKNLVQKKSLLKNLSSHLSNHDIERLEFFLDQVIDGIILKAEAYLPFLGTSASVSTLVGLFGTVWGLIHAFVSISKEKSADIAIVAPGIAEALTTTLAGLLVAIPAMIFFHYFANELKKIEQQLFYCSGRFLDLVEREFLN